MSHVVLPIGVHSLQFSPTQASVVVFPTGVLLCVQPSASSRSSARAVRLRCAPQP
jgi:hypothetical protein